jgi:hypothetical protein
VTIQEILNEIERISDQMDELSAEDQVVIRQALGRLLRPTLSEETLRLRGILATNEPPPSDEEIREDYTNYLEEKYR